LRNTIEIIKETTTDQILKASIKWSWLVQNSQTHLKKYRKFQAKQS
jgi:hypothetical protein